MAVSQGRLWTDADTELGIRLQIDPDRASRGAVYTIGHSTRELDEFTALLAQHDVQCLVDVRRFPGSRRYPHFASEPLAAGLAAIGIAYLHLPALGGRRTPLPESPNGYWRSSSFRAYADYMRTPEFVAGFERLLTEVQQRRCCLMCAEAVPWRCHRQLISDLLVARGFEVFHIIGAGKCDPHTLNPHARLDAGGQLIYPPEAD